MITCVDLLFYIVGAIYALRAHDYFMAMAPAVNIILSTLVNYYNDDGILVFCLLSLLRYYDPSDFRSRSEDTVSTLITNDTPKFLGNFIVWRRDVLRIIIYISHFLLYVIMMLYSTAAPTPSKVVSLIPTVYLLIIYMVICIAACYPKTKFGRSLNANDILNVISSNLLVAAVPINIIMVILTAPLSPVPGISIFDSRGFLTSFIFALIMTVAIAVLHFSSKIIKYTPIAMAIIYGSLVIVVTFINYLIFSRMQNLMYIAVAPYSVGYLIVSYTRYATLPADDEGADSEKLLPDDTEKLVRENTMTNESVLDDDNL